MLSVALSTAGMVQHDLPDLLCSIIASGGSDMLSLLPRSGPTADITACQCGQSLQCCTGGHFGLAVAILAVSYVTWYHLNTATMQCGG